MGSVYIQPSGHNSGRNSSYSSRSSHNNSNNSSGGGVLVLLGIGAVVLAFKGAAACVMCVWSVAGEMFAGAGDSLRILFTALSLISLTGGTVFLFKRLKAGALLLVPGSFLVLWIFLPAGLVLMILIGASGAVMVYWVSTQVIASRTVSVMIASLPVIGAAFYVPAQLTRNDLSIQFGPPTTRSSALTEALLSVDSGVRAASTARTATVSYQVRDNRLFAELARDGKVESIELNTAALVNTPLPWLRHDLSKRLGSLAGASPSGSSGVPAEVFAPVNAALAGYDRVIVADGVLLNHPHAPTLNGKSVFRSVEIDPVSIKNNIGRWDSSEFLRPDRIQIINGVPGSAAELRSTGLPETGVTEWASLSRGFNRAVPRSFRQTVRSGIAATKDAILQALATKRDVLLVVAHSDGYSVKLPNGETFTVGDLKEIEQAIRANRPKVFLFSCETARVRADHSFAKSLLDLGAEVVVAPVTQITAAEALSVFTRFLELGSGRRALPIAQAFERALAEAGQGSMEIWVAQAEAQREAHSG